MAAMLRYKSYVWPYNPEHSSISLERSIAKHKYVGMDGEELEDLHPDAIIISGNGTLFGPDASKHWNDLWYVFKDGGVGQLVHPLATIQAMFKKLKADTDPGDGSIKYEFEFWEHVDPVRPVRTSGLLAGTSAATAIAAQVNTHIVVAGETLSGIALKYLGNASRWTEIAENNGIKNPRLLQIGQVLNIYD